MHDFLPVSTASSLGDHEEPGLSFQDLVGGVPEKGPQQTPIPRDLQRAVPNVWRMPMFLRTIQQAQSVS